LSFLLEMEQFKSRHAVSLVSSRLRLTRFIMLIKLVAILIAIHYVSVVKFQPYWLWQFNLAVMALLFSAGVAFSLTRFAFLKELKDRDKAVYRFVALMILCVGWMQVGVSQERWLTRLQLAFNPLLENIESEYNADGDTATLNEAWLQNLPLQKTTKRNRFHIKQVGTLSYFPQENFFFLELKHSIMLYHTYDSRLGHWQPESAVRLRYRHRNLRGFYERQTATQTL